MKKLLSGMTKIKELGMVWDIVKAKSQRIIMKSIFPKHDIFRDNANISFRKALYDNPINKVEKIHNSKVYHQMRFNLFHLQKYQEVNDCCTEGLNYDKQNKYLIHLKERTEKKL